MLTAEIKINGLTVVYLYRVNEQSFDKDGVFHYRWEAYAPDKKFLKGHISHRREDGALELVRGVIDAVHVKGEKW